MAPNKQQLTSIILITAASAIALHYYLKSNKSSSSSSSSSEKTNKVDSEVSSSTKESSCNALKNSAFVFVKPHANTAKVQEFVKSKLLDAGLKIISESDISGSTIDEKKLIDQHYYAIASKATILSAKDIPVPAEKFKEAFGEEWSTVLSEGRAFNAMDACAELGCTADQLDEAWKSAKVNKFGGGFYCGLVSYKDHAPIYVFNAFFMSMRSNFVGTDASIHCYEVEWEPDTLSWSKFRGELLGPTDPAEGPEGSIRKAILDRYEEFGLSSKPNKGDNGVHASASPFEGLAEKTNWLEAKIEDDAFGKALMDAGLTKDTIKEWSVDPRVELPGGGGPGSVFDALEDLDVSDCLAKLKELNTLN